MSRVGKGYLYLYPGALMLIPRPLNYPQDVDEDRTDIDGDGGLSFLREDAYVHPSLKTPDTIAPEE
ncbi:hypothetical protein SARC_16960, partial [Sphaeroforma arctica JP610]